MKKLFDIYTWEDELLGTVSAKDIITAEIQGSEKFQIESDRIYALTSTGKEN